MDSLVCIYTLSDRLLVFVRENQMQESNPPALQVDLERGTYSVNRLRYFLKYTPFEGYYRTIFEPVEKDRQSEYRMLLENRFDADEMGKMDECLRTFFQRQQITTEWWESLPFEWKTWIIDGVIRKKVRDGKEIAGSDPISQWKEIERVKEYCHGRKPNWAFLQAVGAIESIVIDISCHSETRECLLNPDWEEDGLKVNMFFHDFETKWENAYVLDTIPFMAFPELRGLKINPWALDDLDFLKGLPALEYLEIKNCSRCLPPGWEGWEALRSLRKLKYLVLEKGKEMEILEMRKLQTVIVKDFARVSFPCFQNCSSLKRIEIEADVIRHGNGEIPRLETLSLCCRKAYVDRYGRKHTAFVTTDLQNIRNQEQNKKTGEKIRLQIIDRQEEEKVFDYFLRRFQGVQCVFGKKKEKYPLLAEFSVRENSGLKEMITPDRRLQIPKWLKMTAGSCHVFCPVKQRYWQRKNGESYYLV